MNVALRQPMTLAQFLAWKQRQELRYEFDGVRAIAMAGGTAVHSAMQINLITALTTRLRGKPGRPHGSELKIEVAGHIRCPEAFVMCTPVPPRATVAADPVVVFEVFEVLSDSSVHGDLVVKNAEYRATPSIKRYVVPQRTRATATVFSRKGGDWVAEVVQHTDVLSMPEIGIEISLADFYLDVDFEAEPSRD